MASILNTTHSQEYYAAACEVIPCGVSSSMRKNVKPLLFFERADGPYYFDVDGNKYIDYTLAWGPLIAGSNHPLINKAVCDQLQKSYTLGAQHPLEVALAEKLVGLLPGVEQVAFSNTGSEAVQSAIRIARTYTGRKKIVKFEGHYHGWLNNVLVSYKPQAAQLGVPTPTCGGQPAAEFEDTLVLPWNDIAALEQLMATRGEEIACVITEPILANSGCCMPQEGYLQGVIDCCRKYGAVSIFDEVITGFRIALGGARTYFDLHPDMSVYAKAIAGGFTMAAIGGRKVLFDVIRDGKTIHAGTYNGASVNLAASLATINILSEENCYEKMHAHGNALKQHITQVAGNAGIPLITSGTGTVFSMHFGLKKPPLNYEDTLQADMTLFGKFRLGMLEQGIHLLPDGRWYVGASHTDTELADTKRAIEKVFAELTAS
ncbi:aminotransferase class III-fold pyridoxal phosphate-dependent enzyme [Chitinophaga sp. MM2321]|uniref:aspartate aminotransferase family protein n=1 Tax=Chitinophaga sp. MM2321 TaxID=3137178 RepID=UPI0032D58D8B